MNLVIVESPTKVPKMFPRCEITFPRIRDPDYVVDRDKNNFL